MNEAHPLPSVSVVVPVYNSELTLAALIERLEAALAGLTSAFEIILVNDGSRDRSGERIRELAHEHPAVRAISMMRNYGQHNAILAGIRAARFPLPSRSMTISSIRRRKSASCW